MKSDDIIGTKTEAQAHADWAKRAESDAQAQDMYRKISEYERMRRPMHISNMMDDD